VADDKPANDKDNLSAAEKREFSQAAPNAWSETPDPLEWQRGTTRKGFTGWIAWIDDHTRYVHVKKATCISEEHAYVYVKTADGEHTMKVPHGRLNWSPVAALDMLAIDLREDGTKAMKPLQDRLAEITRVMLLDLVAIELAKSRQGEVEIGRNLQQELKRLEY